MIGKMKFANAALVAAVFFAANGGLLYEPSNYAAQDNLVVNYDGIRNAGLLRAHDPATAVWQSVGRVPDDAEFFAKEGDASAWAADGFHFAGGAYAKLKYNYSFGDNMTVQIVCDVRGSENTSSWPTFFGNWNDRANVYFGDKNNGKVVFKADYSTGLNWESRGGARCGSRVTYLNAALAAAEHKQAIVAGNSFEADWKTGGITATNSVGSQSWSIGSAGNGAAYAADDVDDRYLVGTIKAVRVYNKILSDAELAANRAIDEARFFNGIPVTNVVVATSVPGLDGNESAGAYAYDEGGYTFTAPQKAAKDGVAYACTGYKLETWNGSSWSAPVSFSSCSYTAADTTAKVRLTWQWAYAGGVADTDLDPLFDEYARDGLVFHLDGIRNVGADKPHDPSSPRWVDLVGGKVASIQHDESDASTWRDDGYFFGGRSFAQTYPQLSELNGKNVLTVEIVCDTTTNALAKLETSRSPNILWPSLIGCGDNDWLNVYYDQNSTNDRLTWKNAEGGNNNIAKGTWGGRYATAIRDGTKNYIMQTTNIANAASVTTSKGNLATQTIRIGCAGSKLGKREQRWFLGTIKSVRIYNRVLTDDELHKNREIDEIRFFGAKNPSANVIVASSVRGVSGDEPEGEYALPAGGRTFTAPASVTVGDDVYSCTGYTLETWDGSAWGEPAASASLSCALADASAKVRLTWQWTHTAGPGYDAAFSDYVTDGLVLHLDGVRNTGSLPVHDAGATAWADLAAKGGAANFVVGEDGSRWKDDGYFFSGVNAASYAVMNGTRTLGAAFTAQAVLDFDCNASHRIDTGWPQFVGTTAASGDPFAWYYNQNNTGNPGVNFKVANTHLAAVTGWGGEYVNGRADGSAAATFQTATPAATQAFDKVPGTQTFTIGSGNGSDRGYMSRKLYGTVKSIRLYGRALTDAELLQNRAADELRFFGRSPAAAGDLVVRSGVEGLSGDQPNGAYRPAAGCTFSAPPEAALNGVPYELKGYTLETWDGSAWGSPVVCDGIHAVAPDVSSSSKRLTWNWAVKSRITRIRDDYDVGDYVQDGLYLFYDGIRNAGATAEHDPEATTWANLGTGGASLDAAFDAATGDSSGGWAENGYDFVYGGKFATIGANPSFGNKVTIQVVCEATAGTASFPTLIGSTGDYLNLYSDAAAKLLVGKVFNARAESGDTKAGQRKQMAGTWNRQYSNLDWHAGMLNVFDSTVPDPAAWIGKWRYNWQEFKDNPFYIGGVYKEGDASYINARRFSGRIHAVRVYKRSLLDFELEHNRMVDEARFRGNLPEWNVLMAGKYTEYEGESAGHYLVEGSYTFTAGPATDEGGRKRKVVGYTVETWDGSAWGSPVFHGGGSCTVNAGAKVRITWKWQPDGTAIFFR